MVDESALAALREAGWSDGEVWEITALTAFFNFSGRLEAASSLPPDEIPAGAKLAEAGDGEPGRGGAQLPPSSGTATGTEEPAFPSTPN